jgi:glycosyltransferase involved in cell wall biosynthesis
MGAQPELLTHGIDLDHWRHPHARPGVAGALDGLARPVFLFWGLLDARLDLDLCKALLARGGDGPAARGWLALVGPQQSPPAGLASLGRCLTPGPADYADLPAWAARADALVMPYADLPVTRAMQPLKFKEYLATGKPVIARRLPATEAWADACDLHDDADTFARAAWSRAEQGTPPEQLAARGRLADEAWARKAQLLERNWIDLAPPAAP